MSDSSKDGILALCGTLMALSIIAVGLRLWARRRYKVPFMADDTFVILAMSQIALDVLTNNTLACVKLSALLFYRRIFFASRSWSMIKFLAGFQCGTHFSALWDGNYTKYCTISFPFLYGLVISDFLLDIWILAIPIPGILRLQISARRKFSIVAVFLLAFVGLGASIARMVQYVQIEQGGTNYLLHTDHERLITASFFYTMMESGICLIAVNLPSLRIISFPSTPGEFIRSMRSLIELSFLRGSSTDVARHGSESIGSGNVKEDAETMPASERPSVTSQV
ncbi:hypothetical protein KJ359_001788 [Pestalotiopsis sp. 9143b]|nr:hypothetical protein KJ359_001788 [Pestalotiopsis sp. 9143b]